MLEFRSMKSKFRVFIPALLTVVMLLAFSPAQAQTNTPPDSKTKKHDSPALDVDRVVAHPDQFKGAIGVAGRVAKVDSTNSFFVLGCEDACVAMPVEFSGTLPKEGSDVVVRGEIKKDAQGRYFFEAQNVTQKK